MKKLFVIMFSLVSVGVSAKQTEFPRYTANEKEAINRCRAIDTKALSEIKGQMIAAGVIGTVAGVGNATTAVLTGTKKTEDSKVNIETTIATGVGTAGSTVNTVLSATALSKIQDVIDDLEACQDGLGSIPDSSKLYTDDEKTYLGATAKEEKTEESSEAK